MGGSARLRDNSWTLVCGKYLVGGQYREGLRSSSRRALKYAKPGLQQDMPDDAQECDFMDLIFPRPLVQEICRHTNS